jgi:hypothetical protein
MSILCNSNIEILIHVGVTFIKIIFNEYPHDIRGNLTKFFMKEFCQISYDCFNLLGVINPP